MQKLFKAFFAVVIAAISGISCTEEISDCPNKLCVMAGGWKLEEVQLDGEKYTGDYSKYQLILNDPSPATEISSQFQRVNISGSNDTGTWTIENTNPNADTPFKGSILRLTPSNNYDLREDWKIESFTPRQMILVMNRDISVKDGPASIHFVLVPF